VLPLRTLPVAFLLRPPPLLFEGDQVEWIVDEQLAGQFLHPVSADALDAWRPLVDGCPRIARERSSWERDAAAVSAPVTEQRATP
jgi:hypothetical protein